MRGLKKLIKTLLLSLTVSALSLPAQACMMSATPKMTDIVLADIIFTGSATDFQLLSSESPESGPRYGQALITFHVGEAIKGDPPDEVQLYWWPPRVGTLREFGGTGEYGGIANLYGGNGELIVAAISRASPEWPMFWGIAALSEPERPDVYSILGVSPCGGEFVFGNTEPKLQMIRDVLNGTFEEPRYCLSKQRRGMDIVDVMMRCPEEEQ